MFQGCGRDLISALDAEDGDGEFVAGGEFVGFRPADSEDFTGDDDADRRAESFYVLFGPRFHSTPREDAWVLLWPGLGRLRGGRGMIPRTPGIERGVPHRPRHPRRGLARPDRATSGRARGGAGPDSDLTVI